ncbi:hypothetical protein HYW82_03925 [Candidatus Peregrinibacteria bacterium]|nr:hypothetical protein [Candidatus Peregrinibacteria bacterium]
MIAVFVREIRKAVAVLRLDRAAIDSVWNENGRSVLWMAIFILMFPAVVNVLVLSMGYSGGLGVLFSKYVFWPLMIPAISLGGSFLVAAVAAVRIFKVGGMDYRRFFTVLAYASIFIWATILWFLLEFFGLSLGRGLFNILWFAGFVWILIVASRLLMWRFGLGQRPVLICLGIAFLAYILINTVLGSVLVGGGYRVIY